MITLTTAYTVAHVCHGSIFTVQDLRKAQRRSSGSAVPVHILLLLLPNSLQSYDKRNLTFTSIETQ